MMIRVSLFQHDAPTSPLSSFPGTLRGLSAIRLLPAKNQANFKNQDKICFFLCF